MKARARRRAGKRSADIIPPNPILQRHADEIRALGRQSWDNVVEIGRRLVECRKILKDRRKWLAWIGAEFSWSRAHADRCIAAYQNRTKLLKLSTLGTPISALYMLAKASDAAIAKVERRFAAGERMKAREIIALASQQQETSKALQTIDLSRSDDDAPRAFAQHGNGTRRRRVDVYDAGIRQWVQRLQRLP
jgi:Protein of unknown function (DUF3102)